MRFFRGQSASVPQSADEQADQKAAVLLTGVLVAVGLVVNGVRGLPLRFAPMALAFTCLAGLAVAAGVVLLGACIFPRGGDRRVARRSRHIVGYYGHVLAHATLGELEAALRSRAGASPLERSAHQLYTLSQIVDRKYRLTRLAMWSFAAAGLCAAAVLLAGVCGW